MLTLLYASVLLLMYIGSVGVGLYAWWTGTWAIGLFMFLGCAGFTTVLALPMVFINAWQQRRANPPA